MKRIWTPLVFTTLVILSACTRGKGFEKTASEIVNSLFPPGTNTTGLGDNGQALNNAFQNGILGGLNLITGLPGLGPDNVPLPIASPTAAPVNLPDNIEDQIRETLNELRDGGNAAEAAAELYALLPQMLQACTSQMTGIEYTFKPGYTLAGIYDATIINDEGVSRDFNNGNVWISFTPNKMAINFAGFNPTEGTVNPADHKLSGAVSNAGSNNAPIYYTDGVTKTCNISGWNFAGNFSFHSTKCDQRESYNLASIVHNNNTGKMAGCLNTVTSLVSPAMMRILAKADRSAVNVILTRLLGISL